MDYMNYLQLLVADFPFVCGLTMLVYAAFYFLYGRQRKGVTAIKLIAEFTLLGWVFMYLYVTQFMSFGAGMGERINLVPFRTFHIAFKYGVGNAGMLKQIVLNMVMVMPMGFLLPIVSPKRFSKVEVVLGVSFLVTMLTEMVQYFTLRGADIEDVIANTVGGVLGFGIYSIVAAVLSLIRRKACNRYIRKGRYAGNLVFCIVVFLFSVCPFIAVRLADAESEYGSVYYGHNQPTHVEISESISNEGQMAKVYHQVLPYSNEELQKKLLEATGFNGIFHDNVLEDGSNRIYIYSDGTWYVTYYYGENVENSISMLPTEEEAVRLAFQYAGDFGIDTETLAFNGFATGYADNNVHVELASTSQTENTIIWGMVTVAIGENGVLSSISDGRIYGEFYQEVETISPRQAVEIAQDIGVGSWSGTAYVEDVEPYYYYNKETGFLIPTWRITARFVAESGDEYSWEPNIDAVK